jgi:hypothetical protein
MTIPSNWQAEFRLSTNLSRSNPSTHGVTASARDISLRTCGRDSFSPCPHSYHSGDGRLPCRLPHTEDVQTMPKLFGAEEWIDCLVHSHDESSFNHLLFERVTCFSIEKDSVCEQCFRSKLSRRVVFKFGSSSRLSTTVW